MFVTSGRKEGTMDAVAVVGGQFDFRPGLDVVPTIKLLATYLNSATKTTFGTCQVSANFSAKTLELMMQFIQSAEEDFGKLVFEDGVLTGFSLTPVNQGIETGDGLPKGLGE